MRAREVPGRPPVASLAARRSVAVSRYTAGLAEAAGAGPDRIHVIPPGVDWRAPRTGTRRETPTVLTVARLVDLYEGHDVMAGAMPLIRGRVPGAKRIVLGDGTLRGDIGVSPPWLRPAPGLLGPGALAPRTSWCQLDPGRPHRRARRRAAPGPLVLHVRDRLPRGSHARAPGGAGRPPRRDHRKLVSRRATVSNIGSVHWILHTAPMSSAWLVVTIEVVRRPPAKEAGGLDPCRHVPRT